MNNGLHSRRFLPMTDEAWEAYKAAQLETMTREELLDVGKYLHLEKQRWDAETIRRATEDAERRHTVALLEERVRESDRRARSMKIVAIWASLAAVVAWFGLIVVVAVR